MRRRALLPAVALIGCAGWGFAPANDRIVAQFTIRSGGSVTPKRITVPAHIPVDLSVISRDRRSHRVLLRAAGMAAMTVPAGGRAERGFKHLAVGTYPLSLDGARRAVLDIGGAPGP